MWNDEEDRLLLNFIFSNGYHTFEGLESVLPARSKKQFKERNRSSLSLFCENSLKS
jgi:hypothetical protein